MATTKQPTRFERINGWLTLAANLGVLGGIVLVILQLNQNQKMMRAQTRHEITAGLVELLAESAGNQQLTDVLVRGARGDELNPVEQQQFDLRIAALLRIWEDEHYQYRMGLYDETEFAHERETWRGVLGSSVGRQAVWCRTRGNYSAEFARELNGLIDPQACGAARP